MLTKPVIPAALKQKLGCLQFKANPGKNLRPYLKNTKAQKEGVCGSNGKAMPTKCEALRSISVLSEEKKIKTNVELYCTISFRIEINKI